MINENLWNVQSRMSPKMRKFSSDSVTFKKEARDLDKIKNEERAHSFQRSMRNLLIHKKDAGERQNARRLERLIM